MKMNRDRLGPTVCQMAALNTPQRAIRDCEQLAACAPRVRHRACSPRARRLTAELRRRRNAPNSLRLAWALVSNTLVPYIPCIGIAYER